MDEEQGFGLAKTKALKVRLMEARARLQERLGVVDKALAVLEAKPESEEVYALMKDALRF